jgi:hypothetical protein
MPQSPDIFREFGIIPDRVEPPPRVVRAYFTWGHIVGQYIAVGMLLTFGCGIAALFFFTTGWPLNLPVALGGFLMFAVAAFLVGRNDYVWVELDGDTLRARHLYTQQITERPLSDIADLLTLVIRLQNLSTKIVDAWLGRVRGVEIRFRDGRGPIRISRVDPKMTNAQALTEAIIYRMSQMGEIDAEIVDFQGSPLLRRIYWRE